MKIKIGVMGSSEAPKDKILIDRAREVGREIARHDCILINGATTGMPDEAAVGAKEVGGMVIGISPAKDIQEHTNVYKLPSKAYDSIIYTGVGFNFRNIFNIRTSDALIFIRGSLGTLNEFTIAYEDAKIIGVLDKSGGISDFFDEVIDICKKDTGAVMVRDSDPKKLVEKLLKEVKKRDKI
ncbi:MAG: hypothetical protein HGA85_07370 [Nanoarchaeota archaeon]|nr:hypothetical protein [Nanoarchaeota archaeon]